MTMRPFLCSNSTCGAALGNMPADGSTLKAGSLIVIADARIKCAECGQETMWLASPTSSRSQRRKDKGRRERLVIPEKLAA
jgi:hypothetical protein